MTPEIPRFWSHIRDIFSELEGGMSLCARIWNLIKIRDRDRAATLLYSGEIYTWSTDLGKCSVVLVRPRSFCKLQVLCLAFRLAYPRS